jgi:hypothetical protein
MHGPGSVMGRRGRVMYLPVTLLQLGHSFRLQGPMIALR